MKKTKEDQKQKKSTRSKPRCRTDKNENKEGVSKNKNALATKHLENDETLTLSSMYRQTKNIKLDDEKKNEILSHYILPCFLLLYSPIIVQFLWYTATKQKGSFTNALSQIQAHAHAYDFLKHIIYSILNFRIWLLIILYSMFACLLQRFIPGTEFSGPVTKSGQVPRYRDNGFRCYLITTFTFIALTCLLKPAHISPTYVYDHFGEVLTCLTVASFVLCAFLHAKGLHSPTSRDQGTSGNFIFDYYWGTELHPKVLGLDVKVFTNCRFGMTVWSLLVLIFALKNYEVNNGVITDGCLVSTFLQTLYFVKFFWWEAGYMHTIDIAVDRAGFYICWGCLVYIPGMYASVSLYAAENCAKIGTPLSLTLLFTGLCALCVNYLADRQKQAVRGSDGKCLGWFNKPSTFIRASYSTNDGRQRTSLLLTSGWWGLARHFHYLPELVLALCWTLSVAGFNGDLMPYSYVSFLLVLLVHRTYRDDRKCELKYGVYWAQYKKLVPYKIVPYVF